MNVISKVIDGQEYTYSFYKRKKKNGKFRVITAPCEELKQLQKDFSVFFLDKTQNKFSEEITGFMPGVSIKDNAEKHLNKEWVINLDIKSFFPSTTKELVEWALRKEGIYEYNGYSLADTVEILVLNDHLPQGSPASPVLANYIGMYFIDPIIKMNINNQMGWIPYDYTRYADDVTFSFSSDKQIDRNLIKEVVANICRDLRKETPFEIENRKIKIKHESQRQNVTGIVVNQGFSINRKERMRLRAVMHKVKLGQIQPDSKLVGKLNFVKQIDDKLYNKLTKGVIL